MAKNGDARPCPTTLARSCGGGSFRQAALAPHVGLSCGSLCGGGIQASYYVLTNFLLLNMIIGIIMEHFEASKSTDGARRARSASPGGLNQRGTAGESNRMVSLV